MGIPPCESTSNPGTPVFTFVIIVIVSIVGLIPGQDHTALGIELLIVGLAGTTVIWTLAFHAQPAGELSRMWLAERLGVLAWGTLPFVIGGLSVLLTSGAGLYWIVFGMVGAIVGAVINAWVLLVEILR